MQSVVGFMLDSVYRHWSALFLSLWEKNLCLSLSLYAKIRWVNTWVYIRSIDSSISPYANTGRIYNCDYRQNSHLWTSINELWMQRTESAGKKKKVMQEKTNKKKLPNNQLCISLFSCLAERVVLVFKLNAWRQWLSFKL